MTELAAPQPARAILVGSPLPRTILRLALPAVGSALLTLLFLLVDIFWVGRILGPASLAAVSTAGFAVWILASLGEMIAVGVTAVVVPSQAIQPGQQGPYVFVVKPDLRVEARKVEPGRRLERETVVTAGLKPGERVVTDGHLRLIPGAKVEIKAAKTS